MALLITKDCICCDICVPECPNEAITLGKKVCEIDVNKCTECVGHYEEPQCKQVCPMDCIVGHPSFVETHQQLMEKFIRLTESKS